MKSFITTLSALAVLGGASVAHGAVVFEDDFESPDVTAAQSDGNTSGDIDGTKWVKANTGFGSGRQGTVDEAHGDFTDPVGEQAYAFRYTNSGITTVEDAIGDLTTGYVYTVSFDVVLDGHNDTTPFRAALVTFNGAPRNDARGGGAGNNATALLAGISDDGDGDAGDGDDGVLVTSTYQTITFDYTADGTEATLGQDVALRIFGATSSAIIDNVSVDVLVPEPSSLALLGLGGLLIARRRRG